MVALSPALTKSQTFKNQPSNGNQTVALGAAYAISVQFKFLHVADNGDYPSGCSFVSVGLIICQGNIDEISYGL